MTSRRTHKSPFGDSGSPFNMFFASLLLHLLVFAALVIAVSGPSRHLTFGAPYTVALVSPEAVLSSTTGGTKSLLQPPSADHSVILKRSLTDSKVTPLVKKDEASKTDIEKAISAIRQKELENAGKNKPAAAAPPSGVTGAKAPEQQSRINDYSRFVWSKVKKNWTLPQALKPKDNVETIIDVRIAQSGVLEYIGFEKRSGNSYFDESALRAVKKSAPFPPLAGWVSGRSLEIGIRFHSSELQ
ncbi:MAG: TonB family protein [Deltaproteobacteria bacterium]|nr:TonB family protein [Deltaproteobacteria bacterium]